MPTHCPSLARLAAWAAGGLACLLVGCAAPGAHLRSLAVADAPWPALTELAPGSDTAQLAQRLTADQMALPVELRLPRSGMRFRLIPAGEFTMGSPMEEDGRYGDEGPQRLVRIRQAFYLGVTEVTQAQWRQVMRANPSHFADLGPEGPAENFTWDAAVSFARRLADYEDLPPDSFRLPTEAEWEYACRAGTRTATYGGDLAPERGRYPRLERLAWFGLNSGTQTQPVGQKVPNAWGLHDMLGNVWEWCADVYALYPNAQHGDPEAAPKPGQRVLRGGSFMASARGVRAAQRFHQNPRVHDGDAGLRLVLELSPPIPPPESSPFFPAPLHHRWWLYGHHRHYYYGPGWPLGLR